jgi:hypothetical protein
MVDQNKNVHRGSSMAGHTTPRVIPAPLGHITFECHPGLHQMTVLKKVSLL